MRIDHTMLLGLRGPCLTGLQLSNVFEWKYPFKSVATDDVAVVVY